MPDNSGPRPGSILGLFESTTTLQPQGPALLSDSGTLSYSNLAARASRAAYQFGMAGLGKGSIGGICLDRSPELIISVLGILQAGAAYSPIDPSYPAERIAGMLEDAQPPVVITSRTHQHLFKGTAAKVLLIEDIDLENGPLFEGPCPATDRKSVV